MSQLSIYNWVAIISMALMSLFILIQTRGASLGAGLGGAGEINTERRGTDKTIYQITVLLAIVFGASLILGIVIPTK